MSYAILWIVCLGPVGLIVAGIRWNVQLWGWSKWRVWRAQWVIGTAVVYVALPITFTALHQPCWGLIAIMTAMVTNAVIGAIMLPEITRQALAALDEDNSIVHNYANGRPSPIVTE